jgi:hypothetical protein
MNDIDPRRRDFCIAAAAAVGAVSGATSRGAAAGSPGHEDNPRPSPTAPAVSGSGDQRLWDHEPSLWEAACTYRLFRPLSPVFGWEGPSGGAFGREYSREPRWKFTEGIHLGKPGASVAAPGPEFAGPLGEGVNLANGRVFSTFWGTPERMVVSIGKTDVFNRAAMHLTSSMKPVGQILILAEDFAGIPQPEVCTTVHDGVHRLALANAAAAAEFQVLLTGRETNVFAIKATLSNLLRPFAVRVSRHADTLGELPDPEAGQDGQFVWIRQSFAAEKTFPQGFDYCLVARIVGGAASLQTTTMQAGLGAPVPFRDDSTPGSAATATLAAEPKRDVVIYATVVTRAEADDPLAEAKRRLEAAGEAGFDTLAARSREWYRELYDRRERGRIFTGSFDDAKDVTLPFIFQSRDLSRHTYHSDPDPIRFEGDGNYNVMECDSVFWSGLQCFNEELYTGDYVASRDETIASYYVNLFRLWRPAWEAHAKAAGMPGLLMLRGYVPPVTADVYASPDPFAMDGCDWATMIWAFKCVWDAFDYGDHGEDFLPDTVYPSLRGIADFFAAKVQQGDDGCYHIEPSQLREGPIGRDAVDCVGAIKWAFRTAIAAAEQLAIDADRQAIWRERLARMKPYDVVAAEDGKPVWASFVKDGTPVGRGGGAGFLVNAVDEINLESPRAIRALAQRSNRSAYNGSPLARLVDCLLGENPDRLCMGSNPVWIWLFAHPAWMVYYAQKSRHGDFARDLALQTRPQKAIACWLEPERLLNSRSGTIFFFPCVPSDFDVAFRDFQARGGFLVSAERRGGRVTHAEIKARRDGPCAVMNPWPGRLLRIVELPRETPVAFVKTRGKHEFAARTGTTYLLRPGEAS